MRLTRTRTSAKNDDQSACIAASSDCFVSWCLPYLTTYRVGHILIVVCCGSAPQLLPPALPRTTRRRHDAHMAAARRARERRVAAEARDDLDGMTASLFDPSSHPVIEFAGATATDFSGVTLKADHERRPFWVTPTGSIYLEGGGRTRRPAAHRRRGLRASRVSRPCVRRAQSSRPSLSLQPSRPRPSSVHPHCPQQRAHGPPARLAAPPRSDEPAVRAGARLPRRHRGACVAARVCPRVPA